MGKSGPESEVQKLRRENDWLMQEVVQLRQEHLMTVQKMDALNQRMQSAEVRQKQMVSFLAKVLQNPVFLTHLKQLKEQREIASTRVRRKFVKQQLPSLSEADKSTEQQIVKYNVCFENSSTSASLLPSSEQGEGSAALLPGFEHTEGEQLPPHLLLDMVYKLGLDTGRHKLYGGPDESEDLKGKNLLSSQTDVGFTGTDYFISLPDDINPEEIVSDDISPTDLGVSRSDSETYAFKGKNVINLETDATATGTEYLTTYPEDISQPRMFPDAILPASDYVSDKGIWNIGFEAGGSSMLSAHDAWDNLCCYDAQEMEVAAGQCSLWDLSLHTLEEDLDIGKYVGGESSFQEHKDDGGQMNEDCPRELGP